MISDRRRDRSGDIPARVAARPDPRDWPSGDLMTLREAAKLFWPQGPLTTRSLRTAAEAGQLGVIMIARKQLTCRAAIEEMCKCASAPRMGSRPGRDPSADRPRDGTDDSAYGRLKRKLQRSGR
jgi:hypothetical protein